jgi:hypothetical protein
LIDGAAYFGEFMLRRFTIEKIPKNKHRCNNERA